MPSKVYLPAPPARRLPRHAWLGLWPGRPQVDHLLPREPGTRPPVGHGHDLHLQRPRWPADGAGRRALVDRARTGAVAAATQESARDDPASVGIVGCGLHGAWAARFLAAAEYGPGGCFDPDPEAAGRLAGELGGEAGSLDDALGCDVVTCVTPGNEPVVTAGALRPGVHLNMLGADGPGKAEAEVAASSAARSSATSGARRSTAGADGRRRGRAGRARPGHELGAVLTGARRVAGRTPRRPVRLDRAGDPGPGPLHALMEAHARASWGHGRRCREGAAVLAAVVALAVPAGPSAPARPHLLGPDLGGDRRRLRALARLRPWLRIGTRPSATTERRCAGRSASSPQGHRRPLVGQRAQDRQLPTGARLRRSCASLASHGAPGKGRDLDHHPDGQARRDGVTTCRSRRVSGRPRGPNGSGPARPQARGRTGRSPRHAHADAAV